MKKSPPAGAMNLLNSTNAEAARAGFAASQWNAAVRLQCAVRDATGTNPTLEEALDAAAAHYRIMRAMMPLLRCDVCGRREYASDGSVDLMPQPDGSKCGGHFTTSSAP